MYIYIFEDFDAKKSDKEPSQDDLNACDDGYLSIIRCSDLSIYINGKWIALDHI